MKNTVVKISNRSSGLVSYRIPEENKHRTFQPGETKEVPLSELEKLAYLPGGNALLSDYLLIHDRGIVESAGANVEPEYFMTDEDVIDLIKNGSLDAWLDCLDFAPEGVKDMIKKYSVSVPLSDYEKRLALKEKLKFDVDAAIQYKREEQMEGDTSADTHTRRTQVQVDTTDEPKRRTTVKFKG